MKLFILLTLSSLAYARTIDQDSLISAYGYIDKYSIPLGNKIRAYEEANRQSRIVGGSEASVGQFPYQAGILTNYTDISGTGVCGGSLVSPNRVVYAAHCWYDGQRQGSLVVVVLGSLGVFFGGTRLTSTNVVLHPEWDYSYLINDISIIYLPNSVAFSDTIAPIALPSGSQLNEDFAGETAVASGYGYTSDDDFVSYWQVLRHAQLTTITNSLCREYYRFNVGESTLCTMASRGTNICRGDSGGPLVVTRNKQPLLIGITSFGSVWGCEVLYPAGFARITAFTNFLNQHL